MKQPDGSLSEADLPLLREACKREGLPTAGNVWECATLLGMRARSKPGWRFRGDIDSHLSLMADGLRLAIELFQPAALKPGRGRPRFANNLTAKDIQISTGFALELLASGRGLDVQSRREFRARVAQLERAKELKVQVRGAHFKRLWPRVERAWLANHPAMLTLQTKIFKRCEELRYRQALADALLASDPQRPVK